MKRTFLLIFILCLLALPVALFACTDIQVKAKDGNVVVGRSMELSIDTKARIWFFPRGQQKASTIPKGPGGIAWTSRYGFLGIDSLGEKDYICDGLNEKGLAVEALFFTGAQYQEAGSSDSIAMTDLVIWLLGEFQDVQGVKNGLSKVKVVGVYLPKFHSVQGFHIAVHDALGKNLVIEFVSGEVKVYDNPLGVMTNRPTFDWQMTNLSNYINIDNYDNAPETLGEVKIESTGSGNGWLGIPGDWTPPSRFVRMALFVHKAPQPKNVEDALILANHILFTVDIPHGLILTKVIPGETLSELTQWVVLKDLTNRVLYYRTYNDPSLQMIDLKKLDPSAGAKSQCIPMASPAVIHDVTGELQ